MAAAVAQAQIEAVRITSGYLGAVLTLETGVRTDPPPIDPKRYAGLTRDGRNLSEAFQSPLIGVLGKLKDGEDYQDALKFGLNRATRMVGVEYDHAHRQSMLDVIAEDDRFDGWSRSLAGTCGACASVASGISHGLEFEVHPGCQCVAIAVVAGVVAKIAVPTGQEIFEAKTTEQQDEMVGPEPAALIRKGDITLADLYERSPLEEGPDFITQKPLKALTNETQEV